MMQHKLVIAEKPSVARSIAGVIGAGEKKDGAGAAGNLWGAVEKVDV